MEIQEYKPGDENEILKLFQKTFGKSMSKEYWNWRFLQNSYSSKPLIHLMWDGDNLVGHYALSPVMFKINEDFHLGALSMTTMTDPDYNGRGIFTTLANSLYSEIVEKHKFDFVYGFPNNNSHRGFIKNLRWKDIEIIPSFSVLNPKQISGLKSQSSDFQLLENLKENNIIRYNNLIEDYNIYQFKNLDYINWRYIQNPIHKYYILGNSDYDFVIYKIFKNSDSIEIDIVEWCIPDDFDKVVSVLNSILKE
ncbi:MAG: GNAT family N-acetyltransferase [Saprospiraceae bacterium]|nr:GNAT family N-acetyltransferase [Saprospiraceae bacterium]